MEQIERLREAMKILKNYCRVHDNDCNGCIFHDNDYEPTWRSCVLRQECPSVWNTDKVHRLPTAEELVILNNLDKDVAAIGRNSFGTLYVESERTNITFPFNYFPNLFDFIKRDEKYTISELLKND